MKTKDTTNRGAAQLVYTCDMQRQSHPGCGAVGRANLLRAEPFADCAAVGFFVAAARRLQFPRPG
jgi:hypothetical protein